MKLFLLNILIFISLVSSAQLSFPLGFLANGKDISLVDSFYVYYPNTTDCFAWYQLDTIAPPDSLIASESTPPLTAPQINDISIDNDNSDSRASAAYYISHKIKFTITQIEDDIDTLILTAKGYGSSAGIDDYNLFIWNDDTKSYSSSLNSHQSGSKATLIDTITTNIPNYIHDSGEIYVTIGEATPVSGDGTGSFLYFAELKVK